MNKEPLKFFEGYDYGINDRYKRIGACKKDIKMKEIFLCGECGLKRPQFLSLKEMGLKNVDFKKKL